MSLPVEAGRPLADAIAAEIARRDIGQGDAAKLIGTSQQTVGKWCALRTRPSDKFVIALADFLGMSEAKVRELRGPIHADPRARQILAARVELLERRAEEQARRAEDLISRLERVAQRLDDLEHVRGD